MLSISAVSMGNPHCVIIVDNLDAVALEDLGPPLLAALVLARRQS
jgi:diaminopimelate epimerase